MHSRTCVDLDFAPLKVALEEGHVSRQVLADRIGVAYTTIMRWEKGSATPTVQGLVALAQALGVPIHTLFGVKERRD
jgi:transcriptional regulator with XRE-family HTH domain